MKEYKKYTGRGATGNYSGFGDVFRSGPSENTGGTASNWMSAQMGTTGQSMGNGATIAHIGTHGQPNYLGGGSFQQANQMASRLQQMAMEENGGRNGARRHEDFQTNYEEGSEYGGGGMKRQMNSQGGNRGKKNRGGWNR